MKTYKVTIAQGFNKSNPRDYTVVAMDQEHAWDMAHNLYRAEMNVPEGVFTSSIKTEGV